MDSSSQGAKYISSSAGFERWIPAAIQSCYVRRHVRLNMHLRVRMCCMFEQSQEHFGSLCPCVHKYLTRSTCPGASILVGWEFICGRPFDFHKIGGILRAGICETVEPSSVEFSTPKEVRILIYLIHSNDIACVLIKASSDSQVLSIMLCRCII